MESNPLVSVLIPMHNAENYIEATLQSVLAQTYPAVEIIVVDDGSTDNSYNIASKLIPDSGRIIKTASQGACVARNIALRESSGLFIQYLDADDLLSPGKIAAQVKALKNHTNYLAHCSWMPFKGKPDPEQKILPAFIYKNYEHPLEFLLDSLMGKGMQTNASWLIPRQLVEMAGDWNPLLKKNQDGEFMTRVLLQAKKILFVEDQIVYYRKENLGSVSSAINIDKLKSQLHSFDLISEQLLNFENSDRVRLAIRSQYIGFLYHYYPDYPGFLEEVQQRLKKMAPHTPYKGPNKRFQFLVELVGLRSALRLLAIFRK